MEHDRNLRNLIPPSFLFILMLFAIIDEPCRNYLKNILSNQTGNSLVSDNLFKLLGLIIGASTFIIAFGFIVSSINVFFMNTIKHWYNLDAMLSMKAYKKIFIFLFGKAQKKFRNDNTQETLSQKNFEKDFKKERQYVAAFYDHWIINKKAPELHNWLMRRANAFHIHLNCALTIPISWLLLCYSGVQLTNNYYIFCIILLIIFIVNAIIARVELARMFLYISTNEPNLRFSSIPKRKSIKTRKYFMRF
jgi:hypothetical protein